MSNTVKVVFFISAWACTWLTFAKSTGDCLSSNDDYTLMQALIDEGTFRYSRNTDANSIEQFDFAVTRSYQHYLTYATNIIKTKNPRAQLPCPLATPTYKQLAKNNQWSAIPQVSQLVAPFELTQANNDKAILLIHGLTDSPFSFHDLAYFFFEQGFSVRTMLLPGHGTAPSDLLEVDYNQWQQTADYAIERTLMDFDQVYLGGLSTGGALIFNHLMKQESVSSKIKGLLMWSPASKAKSDLAWLAKYVDYIPFVDWIDLDADIDFAKYESFPYNAAAQVHALMSSIVGEQASADLTMHDIPVFVVASEHDQTIDTLHTLAFLEQWQTGSSQHQNKHSVLVYYGDKANIPSNLPQVMKVISPKCNKAKLCEGVFDVSHIATTNSPFNLHYGFNGKYRNCGHYLGEPEKYQACKLKDNVIKGEVTQANLQHALPMQRLTYNPYYKEMLLEIGLFLTDTH